MNLPRLTVIEASAGTGKTYSLVTRLLRLIVSGVASENIAALTFSRLAAGEIFNSFIERLAEAASSEENAKKENKNLDGATLTRADYERHLRSVIASQHISLIGTLDSFLMRLMRLLPLELGFEGEVDILGDYRMPVERNRLLEEMLLMTSDDARAVFQQAFNEVFAGDTSTSYFEVLTRFIEAWHNFYQNYSSLAWGEAEVIWPKAADRPPEVTLAEIHAMADCFQGAETARGVPNFLKAVRTFSGTLPQTFPKVFEKDENYRQKMDEVRRKMYKWKIHQALKIAKGLYKLMRTYELSYAAQTRNRGLITFDDIPRYLAHLPEAVRRNLDYRLDAHLGHWALDEFQDTSRNQWTVLKDLIDESLQSTEGHTVFIVGDRKQSIYEWRGGDVEILNEETHLAESLPDCSAQTLAKSWRYVPVIADVVNRVFNESAIHEAFPSMLAEPERQCWRCPEHQSARDASGFVQVIDSVAGGGKATWANFFEPIANALAAVKPWERQMTAAILVRTNSQGKQLADDLKRRGITQVVFEGESPILDSPVLKGCMELLRLSEHAEDRYAYQHIRFSPLAQIFQKDGKFYSRAYLSAHILSSLTRLGLVRYFREIREKLRSIPNTWNAFTESRFEDFIKAATEFESIRDEKMRLGDFITFVENQTRRDFAEPGIVRIITMHQSKGLGFDYVILPFYERDGLVTMRHQPPLVNLQAEWMLAFPGAEAAESDETLNASLELQKNTQRYNALCLNYVAMTRAKRGMTLVLHPANKTKAKKEEDEEINKFSQLVRCNLGLNGSPVKEFGSRTWYQSFPLRSSAAGSATDRQAVSTEVDARRPRRFMRKVRPSEHHFSGLTGDHLFHDPSATARQHGVEIHSQFEAIEWATPTQLAQLPEAFRPIFTPPTSDATVWRERAYELFSEGKWETGCFDRVVFAGKGAHRTACIYDFKTNSLREGETKDAFARRMAQTYGSQMTTYHHALSRLTGLGMEQITTTLVLVSTSTCLTLPTSSEK